jgi:hypothetical protein
MVCCIAVLNMACNETTVAVAPNVSDRLEWPKPNLSVKDYAAWLEDESHGFTKRRQFDKIHADAMYVPAEYKAIQELGSTGNDEVRRKEVAEGYSELEFYRITLSIPEYNDEAIKYGSSGNEAYQQRVHSYSFMANHDAKLICGNDTLACPIHTWERSFNASNKIVLEFAFPAKEIKPIAHESREFIFYDGIFGLGPLHYRF